MDMKPTTEINEGNFETEVLKSSQPVLVEFATGWSVPSMNSDGALEEIGREFVDCLKVAHVQLDHSIQRQMSIRLCIATLLLAAGVLCATQARAPDLR